MRHSLGHNALATLAFFDLFDYPLNFDEIRAEILFAKPGNVEFLKSILLNHPEISTDNGYYFLSRRDNLTKKRQERDMLSKKAFKKVGKFSLIMGMVPFVRGIAVCNNLALGIYDQDSDIDLLVITQKGRMFTARFLLTIWLELLGVRRKGNKIAGRFCLSFFLSESVLDLGQILLKDDIYLAYWAKKLAVIYDCGIIFDSFYKKNEYWLKHFFSTKIKINRNHETNLPVFMRYIKKLMEFLLNTSLGDYFEKKLENWQIKRARKKMAKLIDSKGTILTQDMLKFHNIDRREEYSISWKSKLANYKIV